MDPILIKTKKYSPNLTTSCSYLVLPIDFCMEIKIETNSVIVFYLLV